MIVSVIAAFSLGFLGSFHCIAMCGPIAMALPIGRVRGVRRGLLVLLYNSGRILTYSAMGAFAGSIGMAISFAGFQQYLSMLAGGLLLLLALGRSSYFRRSKNGIFLKLMNDLKNSLASRLSHEGKRSLLIIGLLNGLLPCGLVYMGITVAAATGNMAASAFAMAAFGAGTLPVMLAVPVISGRLEMSARKKIGKAIPLLLSAMAILFIIRGLNLGIPYLSPRINGISSMSCHTQLTVPPKKNLILCTGHFSAQKK
jgi:uncharacterized protein